MPIRWKDGVENMGAFINKLMVAIFMCACLPMVALADVTVEKIRLNAGSTKARLVLELADKVNFNVFSLNNPPRIVADLPILTWPDNMTDKSGGFVKAVRFGQFSSDTSRVVIDVSGPTKIAKSFLISPTAGFPYRLVIDLEKTSAEIFNKQVQAGRAARKSRAAANPSPPRAYTPAPQKRQGKQIVVIDAGHGGVDPGALGRKAREKNITLRFAKIFAQQLRATGKYQVYLTRNHDVYIPLRQRVNIAHKHKADLFISIHADAIRKKSVRGMSVYTLSEVASDKEAAALARKENKSDILAGVDFGDHPPVVNTILLDLAQRAAKNSAAEFANLVVDKARHSTKLLERTHRFAGFRVLKSPDVPSVLIELGFLTNRKDEKQLLSKNWNKKVANSLVQAVDAFFMRDKVAKAN